MDCEGEITISGYDAENRLVSVDGAVTATFIYDGDGKRVKATIGGETTIYIGNYFEWTGSTDSMKSYYYAGTVRIAMREGTPDDGTVYYLLGDHLGSTAIITDSVGGKLAEIRYYPWGTERYTSGETPTSYQFTGQRLESDLGLYYYGARYYDPVAGRFIQADTIIPQQQGVQAWDRYAYVNNNPLKYTDPSGNNYCDSDNSIAEDCYGITEYLPDKACRTNVDCYDAYLAYYQLVYILDRKPSDQELLYMTAATEYWAYTDIESVADIGQEALARNYFARCGRDGCQGSEIYRFLAGYEVWTGHAKIIDGNSSTRAIDLLNGWNGGKNTVLTSHIETIINMQNTNHPWTFGYDDNRPWQWFGPFKWDVSNIPKVGYSSEDDAILTIDLGNNYGFWMFTGIQDTNFHRDAWGP